MVELDAVRVASLADWARGLTVEQLAGKTTEAWYCNDIEALGAFALVRGER